MKEDSQDGEDTLIGLGEDVFEYNEGEMEIDEDKDENYAHGASPDTAPDFELSQSVCTHIGVKCSALGHLYSTQSALAESN